MDSILKAIGCMVLATVIITIPILVTASFIYNWYGFIKLVLVLLTLWVWYFVCCTLAELE